MEPPAEQERIPAELHQLVVNHLQEAVRPPVPVVAQADLGVHYLAADPSEPTGGDLYDWYVLPDGDVHLVVVDVIGKGIAATKDALAVVHTLRVLVLEGVPMDALIARADRLLTDGHPGLVATLLVGRYTPTSGRLRLAGGGHPPMLHVTGAGAVEEVAAPGIPLGWPGAGTSELVERHLARGDTAIFYTDGLVEARRDILQGLRELKAAASETASYPARVLPRILVERALVGAQRRDDVVALALRRRATPPDPGTGHLLGPFEHRFSPAPVAVGIARHFFEDWLRFQGIEPIERHELALVASELCTNAVRAASGAPRGVALRAWVEEEDLVVEVEDDGAGLPEGLLARPGLPEPGEWHGLDLVRVLVDEIDAEARPGAGAVVRCRRQRLFATRRVVPEVAPSRPLEEDGIDFSAEVERSGARILLRLAGDIDAYAAGRLRVLAHELDPERGRHLVVDVGGVTFVDSAGIAGLASLLRTAAAAGAVVSLRSPAPRLVKVFEITGLSAQFPMPARFHPAG